MMREALAIVAVAATLGVGGCATQTSQGPGEAAPAAETKQAVGVPAPAGSPLSKVQLGMSKKQVSDILGHPDDENSYASGKAWIPYYYGNDVRRSSWFYKGVGRVVFADGNAFGGGTPEVVRVDYDPSESGVAR
jgi:outer membrane protein assembly factor BamE (lipoprotein component of BamABCDE complex)